MVTFHDQLLLIVFVFTNRMPQNEPKHSEWIHRIKTHQEIDENSTGIFVCSEHFEECHLHKHKGRIVADYPTIFPTNNEIPLSSDEIMIERDEQGERLQQQGQNKRYSCA